MHDYMYACNLLKYIQTQNTSYSGDVLRSHVHCDF